VVEGKARAALHAPGIIAAAEPQLGYSHAVGWDVIVAGTGAMGASACWQLVQRGARVLGLDRYGVPNAQGSSHGLTRAYRLAYFEHPDYVPLLERALAGWRGLEAQAGEGLLTLTGGLYLGRPGSEVVAGTLSAVQLHGLEHERLEAPAVRARWPQFSVPDGFAAVTEQYAGILRVEASLSALARLATAAGAELRTERVRGWSAQPGGVEVRTDAAAYRADQLVLCPGAFAAELLQTDAVRITPTRQVVGWFEPLRPELAAPGRFPVWAAQWPDGRLWYGFAALPGSPGLKLGSHRPGAAVDPATEPRTATPQEEAELSAFAREWLPDDAGRLTRTSVCLYENSPDGNFILDRHPDHANVLIFCGGSGHGFKFAPVIGEVLADLALEGQTAHAVGFLGIDRLQS
jgi:sarcosine oxidase